MTEQCHTRSLSCKLYIYRFFLKTVISIYFSIGGRGLSEHIPMFTLNLSNKGVLGPYNFPLWEFQFENKTLKNQDEIYISGLPSAQSSSSLINWNVKLVIKLSVQYVRYFIYFSLTWSIKILHLIVTELAELFRPNYPYKLPKLISRTLCLL